MFLFLLSRASSQKEEEEASFVNGTPEIKSRDSSLFPQNMKFSPTFFVIFGFTEEKTKSFHFQERNFGQFLN